MNSSLYTLHSTLNRYQGYTYSYPHKLAYRLFEHPHSLESLWNKEDKSSLFLYIHIPFCEMRCGFCNLFTVANPEDSVVTLFLNQLEKQASIYSGILRQYNISKLAIGGGTPTYLSVTELERLILIVQKMGVNTIPSSIEVSPKTATKEKLQILEQFGVSRLSIGIQSFIESEAHELGRPQNNIEVYRTLELMRKVKGADLNLDFIYGGASQTEKSWLWSLKEAMQFQPEELYLYPLYIRPLTGLGNKGELPDEHLFQLYKAGKDFLLSEGYEQHSMRMFSKKNNSSNELNEYSCQQDGMIGLGAGARSYTRNVHYSSEFAVARKGVKSILQHYLESTEKDFSQATYGIELSEAEQKIRYMLKSILHHSGLSKVSYQKWFGTEVLNEFPDLELLISENYLINSGDLLLPTSLLFDNADRIGPAFYSNEISTLIKEAELK